MPDGVLVLSEKRLYTEPVRIAARERSRPMNVDPLQVLSKLAAVYNIPACRVTPPFAGLENFDYGLRKALDPEFDW